MFTVNGVMYVLCYYVHYNLISVKIKNFVFLSEYCISIILQTCTSHTTIF